MKNIEDNNNKEETLSAGGLKEVFKSGLELHDLVEENLKVSQEILKLTKYIRKYIVWQKILSWIKLFLIIVPLILALTYLPPFLSGFSSSFQDLIETLGEYSQLPQ